MTGKIFRSAYMAVCFMAQILAAEALRGVINMQIPRARATLSVSLGVGP